LNFSIILTNYVKIYQLFVINSQNTRVLANQRLETAKDYFIIRGYIVVSA